jgi:hypothetical protein
VIPVRLKADLRWVAEHQVNAIALNATVAVEFGELRALIQVHDGSRPAVCL